MNYEGRRFRSVQNSTGGDVDSSTTFDYHQDGPLVWATYSGGGVRFGTLVALADSAGVLDMRYQHLGADGVLRTGQCRSIPEVLEDGRLRLHESWRWTSGGEGEGVSVVEEVVRAGETSS